MATMLARIESMRLGSYSICLGKMADDDSSRPARSSVLAPTYWVKRRKIGS
jgi:hypothetical protein